MHEDDDNIVPFPGPDPDNFDIWVFSRSLFEGLRDSDPIREAASLLAMRQRPAKRQTDALAMLKSYCLGRRGFLKSRRRMRLVGRS